MKIDPDRLVFIDEAGAKTNMTRLCGRAPRGERVIEYAPAGHWHTTTMLAALRIDRVEAPLVIDGPMDSVVFRGYVDQMLVRTLHEGDVVVMDSLSPHKTEGVQAAIVVPDADARAIRLYRVRIDYTVRRLCRSPRSFSRAIARPGRWREAGDGVVRFEPTESVPVQGGVSRFGSIICTLAVCPFLAPWEKEC